MLHFINQVEYYFVFEVRIQPIHCHLPLSPNPSTSRPSCAQVLECAYDQLLTTMARASDLDDVIAAHNRFLDNVCQQAILAPDSQVPRFERFTLFSLFPSNSYSICYPSSAQYATLFFAFRQPRFSSLSRVCLTRLGSALPGWRSRSRAAQPA